MIHENGAKLPISEATMKKLHKLSRGEIWDAGRYKEKDVDVIQTYADGRSRVRFKNCFRKANAQGDGGDGRAVGSGDAGKVGPSAGAGRRVES